MKKTALLFLPLLLLSCGSKTENDGTAAQSSADIVSYDLHQDGINCVISAEQTGDTPWSLAVGEWLDERLGGLYDGDMRDMKALVDFYGRVMSDSLKVVCEEPTAGVEMEFEATMTKAYETKRFVTYTLSRYIGLGGAHPVNIEEGATFRKSDGRRLDWGIVRNSMDYELNELVRTSLMNYLGVASLEDMEPYLGGLSIYELPLPKTPPYLLENGVAFIYQQYEIMAYAMGMPADTISYERMMPLLTCSAQRLIK